MKNLFSRPAKDEEEKIAQFQKEREGCRDRIRKLREQIKGLEDSYEQADDLDQKILEGDVMEKKGILEAETEHFGDLSELIVRLQKMQRIERTKRNLLDVFRISKGINVEEMLKKEDELKIRRQILIEEE